MLDCKVGDVLMLEYQPGMFRKVSVKHARKGFTHKRGTVPLIKIDGIDSDFFADTGQSVYSDRFGFSRKLSPVDQSKIDATKDELRRRKLRDWFVVQDYCVWSLERLERVYAEATK